MKAYDFKKMNSFTDILQEFCLDFKQRCITFRNFQNNCSTENLLMQVPRAMGGVLCNDLPNMFLHVCRNCWKTLWTDSSNALINDIPPKRIKRN